MRVGIVGLGHRMAVVANLLRQADARLEFVAYADPSPMGLEDLARSGHVPAAAYTTLEAMLEKEQLDLLMIGTPNHLHLSQVKLAMAAGVRVFLEKPVVITAAETSEMLELVARHGADKFIVGLVLRYAPLYRQIMQAIADGHIGAVCSLEATELLAAEHGAFFMRDWRRYEKFSGGFMLEKCCHDIDLYNSIVGSHARRVSSFGGRNFFDARHAQLESEPVYHGRKAGWSGGTQVFASDADIVDSQTALIEYENGAVLSFHTNINAGFRSRRFCIVGTNGTAEGDFETGRLRITNARTGADLLLQAASDDTGLQGGGHYGADAAMARDICAHLFDGKALPVSIHDALTAGLTAIKIDEARKSGTVVDMPSLWSGGSVAVAAV